MSNGKTISVPEAFQRIKGFEDYIMAKDPDMSRADLAIGHKFDLSVLRDFLSAIDRHPNHDTIDAVRIYFARNPRGPLNHELFNLVLVPVYQNDNDIHPVFGELESLQAEDTILSDPLPCPNVCPLVQTLDGPLYLNCH